MYFPGLSISANATAYYFDGVTSTTEVTPGTDDNGLFSVICTEQDDANNQPYQYDGLLTATFSGPTTNLSFQVEDWRTSVWTVYGLNADGSTFSNYGIVPDGLADGPQWFTVTPIIPGGGSLTSFTVYNRDPQLDDAAFWVQDIGFVTNGIYVPVGSASSVPVPDGGSTALLLGVAMAGMAIFWRNAVRVRHS